ncbi:MAG: hypothetical protein NTZ98_20320 [Acidobacteria bacterium]|nr:hypothetical protein [Acidobacteriota bacterium]
MVGITVSRYRVVEPHAGGGMGIAYGSEGAKLGRRTALKLAVCWVALAFAAAAGAQQLPPETVKLARIRQKAAEQLSSLPDYTCLETVERTWRGAGLRTFMPIDVVRFEVAHVGGRELYAWPGARQRNIFLSRAPLFRYVGEENLGAWRTLRYDYRVPLLSSNSTVSNFSRSAYVAYHGSFWADAETLELIRITSSADDIPPDLEIASTFTQVDYGKLQIANSDVLLPQRAEIRMVSRFDENRNVTAFSQCRKYVASSAVSFEPRPEGVAAGKSRAVTETELPAGLFLEIALQTPIDSKTSAVGDLIEAKLQTNIIYEGKVLAPAGAVVRGRVRRLEKLRGWNDVFLVGLAFNELEFPGHRARFLARLRDTEQRPGLTWQLPAGRPYGGSYQTGLRELPNVSTFFVRRSRVQLPQGFRMAWRTTGAGGPSR